MADEQALLDAIRAEPDERDNYLVYGDWLSQQGDPRGELIGFQHALEANPGDAKLARRVAELIAAQEATLPRGTTATWKLGFVDVLRVEPTSQAAQLRAGLRHPLVQLARGISLVDQRLFDAPRSPVSKQALATLLADAPSTVRRLELGAATSPLFDAITDVGKLLDRFPRLSELTLHATRFPPGLVELLAPRLVELELASTGLTDKLMREIAKASWPQLRTLVLRLPWKERTDQPTPLAPLVVGRGFPELRELRLREYPTTGVLTDRFCGEIVRSRLLPQLEVLDFSVRGLDLDAIRPAYPKLRHLKRLLPSAEEEVDTADLDALQRISWLLEEPDTPRAIELSATIAARAKSAHDRHNTYRRLGTCLCLMSRLDEALAAFEQSLAAEATCGVTLHHYGIVLKRLGRIADARRACDDAVTSATHPARNYAVEYLDLSLALADGEAVDADRIARVRDAYAKQLETSAVDADLFYDHACLCALAGDPARCLESLTYCFEICPPYKVWARDEPDLRAMADNASFRALIA